MICYLSGNYRKLFFLSILALFACHNDNSISVNESNIKERKAFNPDGQEVSYHYILPAGNKTKATALLIAVDPHGNGKLGVKQFLPAVNRFHCVVIGLDNVRNNIPDFEQKMNADIADAIQEFFISEKPVIFAGFSGGARMALQYGYTHNAAGIIMCGAGPGNLWLSKLAFPLVAISGTHDFNFAELYYPPSASVVNDRNKLSLFFEGKHEWPSPQLLTEAVSYIYLRARINKKGVKEEPDEFINRSDSLAKKGNYLMAFKELEMGTKVYPENDDLKNQLNSLLSKPDCNNYFYQLISDLKDEYNRNNVYVSDLDKQDTTWWKHEIKKIDGSIANTKNKLQSDSYSRTRAFLGILMYSKTSAAFRNNMDENTIKKYLDIYRNLEPDNPDVFYYKALLAYKDKNTKMCIQDLTKSSQLGFNDYGRLHSDFPKEIYDQVFKSQ